MRADRRHIVQIVLQGPDQHLTRTRRTAILQDHDAVKIRLTLLLCPELPDVSVLVLFLENHGVLRKQHLGDVLRRREIAPGVSPEVDDDIPHPLGFKFFHCAGKLPPGVLGKTRQVDDPDTVHSFANHCGIVLPGLQGQGQKFIPPPDFHREFLPFVILNRLGDLLIGEPLCFFRADFHQDIPGPQSGFVRRGIQEHIPDRHFIIGIPVKGDSHPHIGARKRLGKGFGFLQIEVIRMGIFLQGGHSRNGLLCEPGIQVLDLVPVKPPVFQEPVNVLDLRQVIALVRIHEQRHRHPCCKACDTKPRHDPCCLFVFPGFLQTLFIHRLHTPCLSIPLYCVFRILFLIYSTQVAGACLPPHTVFCRFFPNFFLTAIILSPAKDD